MKKVRIAVVGAGQVANTIHFPSCKNIKRSWGNSDL